MKSDKKTVFNVKAVLLSCLVMFLFHIPTPAKALLNESNFIDDLNQLVIDGNNLIASMESVTLVSVTMSSQLVGLEGSVQTYLESVGSLFRTVSSSTDNSVITITDDMLLPLQALSTITFSLAQSMLGLSVQITTLAPATLLPVLSDSLDSMLQLSSDIGVMADRILEMADMILIMADNIGVMADRILATQVIQGDNIALVVNATLETQKNMLMLFSMFFAVASAQAAAEPVTECTICHGDLVPSVNCRDKDWLLHKNKQYVDAATYELAEMTDIGYLCQDAASDFTMIVKDPTKK